MVQHLTDLTVEKSLVYVRFYIAVKNELKRKLFQDVVRRKVEDHPLNYKNLSTNHSIY